MDDLSADSPVQTVVWMKAAQVGASEAGNNWVAYIMDHAPGPILVVQPTVDLAKRYSRQRIEPMIEASERLQTKVSPAKSRDSSNTVLMKDFQGGILVMTGANSAVGLRSMPVRYLFLDEVDAYNADVEEEGDPVALAEARQRTFGRRAKKFIPSTPKLKGSSRIARYYEASDQRKYFIPCPLCDEMQVLTFDRLKWEPSRPDTVAYQCVACEGKFNESHKTGFLAAGEWRATRESNDENTRGYHLSALYSPVGWLSWADIARQWEAAVQDTDLRKTFINTVLGECFEEDADALPDFERLIERAEDWPHATVPERGLFLTAGCDVQADRIECDIWAWGRQNESWLVEHLVIYGDTSRPDTWKPMNELLSRTWEHATGARLSLQRLAVDSGAYTQSVYDWARKQDRHTVMCIKGFSKFDRLTPVSGPTRIDMLPSGEKMKRGVNLFGVSVAVFKKELYRNLLQTKPSIEQLESGLRYPAGYVHLPKTVPDEWVKQLVAEQLVIVRDRRGFAHSEWRQLRPRNEALDCRIYARAAAWLSGADRWSEAKWKDLESQLGLDPPSTERVEAKVEVVSPIREMVTEQQVNPLTEVLHPVAATGGMIRRGLQQRRRVRY
jgi:phage terminase large subunit GpA-like protein